MSKKVIQILLDSLEKRGIAVQDILLEIIRELHDRYFTEKDCDSLIAAKEFIELYDELGLQRETHYDIFEKILKESAFYDDIKNISTEHIVENVMVNKTQIRRLLGRWNPKSHSMPIEKVVEDIINKVNAKQMGSYGYWTEQRIGKERRKFEYKLVINQNEIFFYDCYNEFVYRLEGRDKNDENSTGGR